MFFILVKNKFYKVSGSYGGFLVPEKYLIFERFKKIISRRKKSENNYFFFVKMTRRIFFFLVSCLVYFNVKIAGSRGLGLHPETGLSSICSGTRTIQCTGRHNRLVISISADTCTVQRRFPELQVICRGMAYVLISNQNQVIDISKNISIGLAASDDLVTYLMVTAEVGLPACSLVSIPRTETGLLARC